jgi:heme/copper-type cytochrome/quinol oxidase subunit 1
MPMHVLGLQGMRRRIAHYAPQYETLNQLATIGAYLLGIGMIVFLVNFVWSMRKKRTATADPWEGNSLEWATTSPPPPWNFDSLPPIRSERPVFDARVRAADATHTAAAPEVTT